MGIKMHKQMQQRKYRIKWPLFLISLMIRRTKGQSNCSCSPLIYKWKLDFSLSSCRSSNLTVGPSAGISESFCELKALDDEKSNDEIDVTPVKLDSFAIIELSHDLLPIKVQTGSGLNITDGDFLSFSSLTAVQSDIISGGIQATLGGVNSFSQKVQLSWIVTYSNLCSLPPFESKDSLGWMVFFDFTPARPETCFPQSTEMVGATPSQIPTDKSSTITTKPLKPFQHPSTNPPTTNPSHDSTVYPTSSIPSSGPSMQPTETSIPSHWPTPNHTFPPSLSPTVPATKAILTDQPSETEDTDWLSYSMSMFYFSMDFETIEDDSEFFF